MRFVQRLPSAVLNAAAVVGVVALVVLGIVASRDGEDAPPPFEEVASPTTGGAPIPAPPPGVERATTFAPDGVDVRLQVPSTWVARDGEDGYEAIVESPGGGDAFVLVDQGDITEAQGRRRAIERLGATVSSEDTTTVDGHGAQVLEYDAPFPGRGIGNATEVDIDLADGTYAIVVVASLDESTVDPDVLDWIVDTIRVRVRS